MRNDKEAEVNEHESKARLIVKRIATKIADDPILSCEWGDMGPDQRDRCVREWTKIATKVLGEKDEPLPPEQVVRELCKRVEPGFVMAYASRFWADQKGAEACVIGPSRDHLTNCGCDEPGECEWCCGTNKITHRVKQAKDEHEHVSKPTEKTGEEFDPVEWRNYQMVQRFICSMQSLGARKIEVPASRNGSFCVEFDRGKPPPMPDPGGGSDEAE